MITVVTLIMWVFLSNGSQTYTTRQTEGLTECLVGAQKYLQQDPHLIEGFEGPGATLAAGCEVHEQRGS
jgi:hypothetical protein